MNLTKDKIWPLLRKIAFPASIGLLFTTIYNLIDLYFAGYINQDALTAISIIFPLFILISAVASGMSSGIGALFGNTIGQSNLTYARQVLYNGLLLGLLMSIILPFFGPLISPYIISLLTESETIAKYATDYINILFIFSFTFIIPGILSAILTALGNTKTYRNILIVGAFLNVLFDYLFVTKFGIAGIAYSTVIIQFIQMIYLFYATKREPLLKGHRLFAIAEFKLNLCTDVIKQSAAPTLATIIFSFGIFIYNYYIALTGGDTGLAGFGVAYRIEQLLLIPVMGVGTAVLSLISQNNGAMSKERVKESVIKGLILAVVISLIGEVILVLFLNPIIHVFTTDQAAIMSGKEYIYVEIFIIPFYALMTIANSVFQGIKRPNINFYFTVIRQIILPVATFSIAVSYFDPSLLTIFIIMGFTNVFTISAMGIVMVKLLKENFLMYKNVNEVIELASKK